MLKKIILSGLILVMAATACQKTSGRYSEVKSVLVDLIKTQEIFLLTAEKAVKPEEVVMALSALTESLMKLKPKMLEFEKKYPELKQEKYYTSDLKETIDQFNQMNDKFALALQAVMAKWGAYAAVQKAFMDLKAVSL